MYIELSPKKLITNKRFDLIVKYLYTKNYVNKYNTDYYLNMYKEHLRVWNNFIEYDNKNKNNFEIYRETFHNIINDVINDNFDFNKSPIPIFNDSILNGSHRLSAALVSNKNVLCKQGLDGKDGQYDCDWLFFKNKNYDTNFSDRVALEYSLLKKNTHVITIFPKATQMGKINELDKIIKKNGKIFYSKKIELKPTGLFNLIRELYLDEPWVGNHPKYDGYLGKTQYCYGNSHTLTYLCEFNSLEDCIKTKEEIRKLYNIGKHSVHINDTHEETVRICKAIFNNNSVKFLNDNKSVIIGDNIEIIHSTQLPKFEQFLKEYINNINKNGVCSEDYCVTSSSVLGVYGLRDVSDLDYIHSTNKKIDSNNVHSHNDYGLDLYTTNYDNIIHNPENHFYSRGIKFTNINLIKQLKEKRMESKDIVDLALIKKIYE
jgi:hypothetical protein